MAKKKQHGSHHDDELAVDDEPEAGWTEDTHAEQHEGEAPDQQPPAKEPPPPPPATRIQAVITQLQHHAAHNAPVPPSAIKELQAVATVLAQDQGGAPATPVIDSIDPATAPEGTINMTVTGRNFSTQSVLCYGDVNQDTTVSPDLTQLTATFESGPPGIYDVNVHDPAGDANTMQFEVT